MLVALLSQEGRKLSGTKGIFSKDTEPTGKAPIRLRRDNVSTKTQWPWGWNTKYLKHVVLTEQKTKQRTWERSSQNVRSSVRLLPWSVNPDADSTRRDMATVVFLLGIEPLTFGFAQRGKQNRQHERALPFCLRQHESRIVWIIAFSADRRVQFLQQIGKKRFYSRQNNLHKLFWLF